MKTSPKPQVAELRAAKVRHDRAKVEVERIEASAAQAPAADMSAATAAADEALAAARRAYEDTAGAHALGDATEADLAQAYARLDAAQRAANRANDDAQRAEAAVVGLARKLEAAKTERDAAAEALREAEIAWLLAERVNVDAAYCEAAEAFGRAAGRAQAFRLAIAHRRGERYPNLGPALAPSNIPVYGVASDEIEQRKAIARAFAVDAKFIVDALAEAARAA